MPITGLPSDLENVMSDLLHSHGLSSWSVKGHEGKTVLVLKFDGDQESSRWDAAISSSSSSSSSNSRRKGPDVSSDEDDHPRAKRQKKEPVPYPFTPDGPANWDKEFPIAKKGLRQSPINIDTKLATYNEKLAQSPLSISYKPESNMEVVNTGMSYKVACKQPSELKGGPLQDTYQLEQFHFHWGARDDRGSEHTLNGKTFAAELHLVHWNASKYKSFGEAADKPDGLAVLGIFLNIGKKHDGLDCLTCCMDKVKCKDKCDTIGSFNPACLLPKNTSRYWTYPGSLTTPPLFESVTWIVFEEVVEVSKEQIEALRGLCFDEQGCDHIVDNYRPPVPLGTRILNASFK